MNKDSFDPMLAACPASVKKSSFRRGSQGARCSRLRRYAAVSSSASDPRTTLIRTPPARLTPLPPSDSMCSSKANQAKAQGAALIVPARFPAVDIFPAGVVIPGIFVLIARG